MSGNLKYVSYIFNLYNKCKAVSEKQRHKRL